MTAERALLTLDGAVVTVTINRPEARNSLLRGMGAQLYACLRKVADKKDVRILILRGTGADLKPKDTPVKSATDSDFDAYQVSVLLHEMPQVTIAAIRGTCAGAGLGYAAACDLRVGDDDVRINTAFLDDGVAGNMGHPGVCRVWSAPDARAT